jgi:Mg/Co/Ni transporter MgtE
MLDPRTPPLQTPTPFPNTTNPLHPQNPNTTTQDYIRKIVEAQRKTRETPIAEIMTPAAQIVSAPPTMSVGDCMALLVEKKIRHVPVIDAGGKVQGVVSTTDLVNTMKRDDESLAGAFPLMGLDAETAMDLISQSRERANELAVKGGEGLSTQDLVRGGMVGLGAGVVALLLQVRVGVCGRVNTGDGYTNKGW